MRVGIGFANVTPFDRPDAAADLARAAEAAGVESLWTVEHVVIPQGYASRYPYSSSGRMAGDERVSIPDPLVWLAYVAALTERIRLATGVLILPERNPVILAKELATLDVLSGGRVICGVGIGWLEEEFAAIGVPFADRAARAEEAIRALRALWSADETFEGERFRFREARSYPKPLQPGGIPIVVGGHAKAAARRAGRWADGFFPAGADAAELIGECRRAAARAGRDPASVEITVAARADVDEVRRLADLGVTRVVVGSPARTRADLDRAFGAFAESFVTKV